MQRIPSSLIQHMHTSPITVSELTITMSLIRPWCPENFLTIFLVSISKTLILKSSKAIPRIPLPKINSIYDHEYSEIKKRKTSITLLQKYHYPKIISGKSVYTLLQTSTTSRTTSSLLHFKHQKLKFHYKICDPTLLYAQQNNMRMKYLQFLTCLCEAEFHLEKMKDQWSELDLQF